MPRGLNLASRPFVNTRPANLAVAVFALAAVLLSVVSLRTVRDYLDGSGRTRASIAALKDETGRLSRERASAEAAVARLDLSVLAQGAADAAWIARRRAFSWTRFLSRLEATLPNEVRVTRIQLQRPDSEAEARRPVGTDAAIPLELELVCRDPDGFPKVIRTFYASEWFDHPEPRSEEGPEVGTPEGTRLLLDVRYLDGGKGEP